MFVGAVSYFRNPAAHFRRTSEDVLKTMEELIFCEPTSASRRGASFGREVVISGRRLPDHLP
jgi:hypothetical protein